MQSKEVWLTAKKRLVVPINGGNVPPPPPPTYTHTPPTLPQNMGTSCLCYATHFRYSQERIAGVGWGGGDQGYPWMTHAKKITQDIQMYSLTRTEGVYCSNLVQLIRLAWGLNTCSTYLRVISHLGNVTCGSLNKDRYSAWIKWQHFQLLEKSFMTFCWKFYCSIIINEMKICSI